MPGLGLKRGEGCHSDIRKRPLKLAAGGYQVLEGILFEPPQLRESRFQGELAALHESLSCVLGLL